MAKLSLNSIPTSVFKVNASEVRDGSATRAAIVGAGRLLNYEYARKGLTELKAVYSNASTPSEAMLTDTQYKELNEKFQEEHLLYAANQYCAFSGRKAPETFDEFKAMSASLYGNAQFYAILQGIYEEIISPILPRVYSEAVSIFADIVEVGFGETYALTVDSNDIPVFQDAAWGAQRSVPRNRFYAKDYTLSPQPKTAQVFAKWTQLISNNMDFGRWFANITAGIYAKTMGMWNAAMTAAATDTSLIPSGFTYTFSNENWVRLANKVATVNNTSISNIIAFGGAVALSKVLPTEVTGSTNVNMDAAIATLLGADYTKSGYLGEFMSVRLMPLTDAVIPGTQNGSATTILPEDTIWMMAGNGRKPLTIAYNSETPITLEIDPTKAGDMEIGINLTIALDSVAVFASRIGLVDIS